MCRMELTSDAVSHLLIMYIIYRSSFTFNDMSDSDYPITHCKVQFQKWQEMINENSDNHSVHIKHRMKVECCKCIVINLVLNELFNYARY